MPGHDARGGCNGPGRRRPWRWMRLLLPLLLGLSGPQATWGAGTVARTSSTVLPELGEGRLLGSGIRWHEIRLSRRLASTTIWIYLPEPLPEIPVPCVLIAPAGTALYHGITLGAADRSEHLPYVREGYVVVAYELDGDLADSPTRAERVAAARAFMRAEAGLINAQEVLDYALARVPAIDRERIYTAGHSSAGTVSLLVAAQEPRIRGCIAYAPVCDVAGWLGEEFIDFMAFYIPDFREFTVQSSPRTHLTKLTCPLFLFHAEDDTVVPIRGSEAFAEELSKTNSRVTFARVVTGGHFSSMIRQGIPQAIRWLGSLPED
jgi:dienelactone hydrolase